MKELPAKRKDWHEQEQVGRDLISIRCLGGNMANNFIINDTIVCDAGATGWLMVSFALRYHVCF